MVTLYRKRREYGKTRMTLFQHKIIGKSWCNCIGVLPKINSIWHLIIIIVIILIRIIITMITIIIKILIKILIIITIIITDNTITIITIIIIYVGIFDVIVRVNISGHWCP